MKDGRINWLPSQLPSGMRVVYDLATKRATVRYEGSVWLGTTQCSDSYRDFTVSFQLHLFAHVNMYLGDMICTMHKNKSNYID